MLHTFLTLINVFVVAFCSYQYTKQVEYTIYNPTYYLICVFLIGLGYGALFELWLSMMGNLNRYNM